MKKHALYLAIIVAFGSLSAFAAEEKSAADAKASQNAAKAWSPYAPITAPAQPEVKQKAWVRTPIDAFVLQPIEAAGIKPSPETDRATFIRRATLDAWGLLPTPEEVKAFVGDRSPNAYEKLVDRLLASPHYGERQARRWLDLARYADSTGFQNDGTRPNNWRYRDYVITAFNNDKPYNRFIQEQLAGDELYPDSQEAKIATGFLAGYPDNANSRDLVQRKYEIETDVTNQVGEVFLGATIGCARCHNHKSDKISQKEYFQLQAYFANTAFDQRVPLAKGSETKWDTDFQKAQTAYRDATKSIRDKQRAILDTVRAEGEKYHKERYLTDSRESIFKPEKDWTPLDRWVNFRLKTVSSDQDVAGYLRLAATDKNAPEYKPELLPKWQEYQELTKQLRQFDNQRPGAGSAFYTSATELGHPESPATFVRFTGIHERPTEEVQPAIPALWASEQPKMRSAPRLKKRIMPFSSTTRIASSTRSTRPSNGSASPS